MRLVQSFTAVHDNSFLSGALWARIAQNVKKPPLTVNVIDFEFFGFDVSIWDPWNPLGPRVARQHCYEKKAASIGQNGVTF